VERTRGVTFLSLVFCALGVFLAAISIWSLRDLVSWGLLQFLDTAILAMFLVAGLTCSVAAIGLFQLRNWGRRFIMVFSLFMIIAGLAGIILSPDQFSSRSAFFTLLLYRLPHFNITGGVLAIILGLTAIWYLSKPRVKFLFWW